MIINEIPVYLINLHNRPERLLNTINELRKVDLHNHITRIEACDYIQAQENQHLYLSKKSYTNLKNPSSTLILPNYKAVGCAISHINTWKMILNYGFRDGIIIEDDIEITDSILFKIEMNKMKQLLENIKKNDNNKYDKNPIFITFNANINSGSSRDKNCYKIYDNTINSIHNYCSSETYFKKISGQFTGTHFYYINNNMIQYLLEKLEKNRLTYQIDIQIYNFIKEWNLYNSYIYNLKTNSIIQSKKFISDVQWFNYRPFGLSIVLKIPIDISHSICRFLTNFTKKNNEILFNNIYIY